MTRSILAGLALVGALLASGCGGDPTCDDVESLTREIAEMDPDDPDFNDRTNDLAQALADCNE